MYLDFNLVALGLNARRHHASDAQTIALGERKRRAFVVERVVQQIYTALPGNDHVADACILGARIRVKGDAARVQLQALHEAARNCRHGYD